MQELAVEVHRSFEADPRRPVELRNHHPLCTVDDKSSASSHQREFAHVDFLLFRSHFVLQPESHVERGAECLAVALRFQRGKFGRSHLVSDVIKIDLIVVAIDREDLGKNCLKSSQLPLGSRHVHLKKAGI